MDSDSNRQSNQTVPEVGRGIGLAALLVWAASSAACVLVMDSDFDKYLDEQKPWELAKRDRDALQRVLGHVCEALRLTGLFLFPFLPATGEKIWAQLGMAGRLAEGPLAEAGRWGAGAPRPMSQGEALFPRVEFSLEETAPMATTKPGGTDVAAEITIEEFRRLDLRVAEIREARAVRGSKKLVELRVSIGSEERTIVAGILLDYSPADLVGKQIVIVANLKPTTLMGVESRGMLLAANESGGRIILVTPEKPAAPGSQVK